MSETGINGAAGAEDGEEKTVCIGLPHKVHTVPVVSFRLRVALYFVNIFAYYNKGTPGCFLHGCLFNKQLIFRVCLCLPINANVSQYNQ